jgi:hypothetical protein
MVVFFNFITQFNLLVDVGLNPNFFQPPLVIERSLLGGLVFGFGMILAGGCVAGILFRIGEGQLSSVISFLGLMVGFAVAIILEAIGLMGSERSLYPSGNLLPQILQIPPLLLVTLVSAFLLTIIMALRRSASWKVLIAIIIIFVLTVSVFRYVVITESIQLTENQVEVDLFVNEFYVTLANRSAIIVLSFPIACYRCFNN